MDKIFFMQARQSGKTSAALVEFNKDPTNSIYLTINNRRAKEIQRSIVIGKDNIISYEYILASSWCYSGIKTLIIDDYMQYNYKGGIHYKILTLNPEKLIIFSTSDQVYDRYIFEGIKKLLRKKYSLASIIKLAQNEYQIDQIEKLYYSFLADIDTKIIGVPTSTVLNANNLASSMFDKRYNLEILNIWLQ